MTRYPSPGALSLWQPPPVPVARSARAATAACCLLAAAAWIAWVWTAGLPDTIVRTRILADSAGVAGRRVLAEVALRFAAAPDGAVSLQDNGTALVVSAQAHVPADARQRNRSLVNTILEIRPAAAAVAGSTGQRAALQAERARLLASWSAVDQGAATISAALTLLARDMAAAQRGAAERKPGRSTADKGAAALAELQIQRFQLLARYQADYPAVIAMDAQIRDLRTFLADEAHRTDARPAPAEPADAVLAGERDRLRAELVQSDDRRRALGVSIAAVERRLSELPPDAAAPSVADAVLVEAATTTGLAADGRVVPVTAIAVAGILLAGASLLLGRLSRRPAFPYGLVLDPGRLGLDQTGALPPALPVMLLPMPGAARDYSRS